MFFNLGAPAANMLRIPHHLNPALALSSHCLAALPAKITGVATLLWKKPQNFPLKIPRK